MRALRIYAGPAAIAHVRSEGLLPQHIGLIPGAAGGPKGLILGPLDRLIFGHWLARSQHPVHLVGASIGAWRMASACLSEPLKAFERLEHDYIHQDYRVPVGRRRPLASDVSSAFARSLHDFYGQDLDQLLRHPRYRLHLLASRGRLLLARERPARALTGYLLAYLSNALRRQALGHWLERVVFSSQEPLPLDLSDYRTSLAKLDRDNFFLVLRASCSIPFVLEAVADIPGAPSGAYWDGGLTDYHLHLNYAALGRPLVLYPHFQRAVVPGWLDKGFKRRHRATPFLNNMLLLAPDPQWVARLPNGKLPDRRDFDHYANDMKGRIRAWTQAAQASRRLADELAAWLAKPDPSRLEAI